MLKQFNYNDKHCVKYQCFMHCQCFGPCSLKQIRVWKTTHWPACRSILCSSIFVWPRNVPNSLRGKVTYMLTINIFIHHTFYFNLLIQQRGLSMAKVWCLLLHHLKQGQRPMLCLHVCLSATIVCTVDVLTDAPLCICVCETHYVDWHVGWACIHRSSTG